MSTLLVLLMLLSPFQGPVSLFLVLAAAFAISCASQRERTSEN